MCFRVRVEVNGNTFSVKRIYYFKFLFSTVLSRLFEQVITHYLIYLTITELNSAVALCKLKNLTIYSFYAVFLIKLAKNAT